MDIRCTDSGKEIRLLRSMRGMERTELAEASGISDSHLKKIESGTRQPGMVVMDEGWTRKENCIVKVQGILIDSTEEQAVFMASVMEAMAKNIGKLAR